MTAESDRQEWLITDALMANLQDFPFTLAADVAVSTEGWTNADGVVDALLGDDSVVGRDGDVGIEMSAAIFDGNLGDDTLSGIGKNDGIRNADASILIMGLGNDLVSGEATSGYDGLVNDELSLIDTGLGDDQIVGLGSTMGDGIRNAGHSLISTGLGHDSISGVGGMHGLHLEVASSISTGLGNDWISGIGTLEEGIINAALCRIDTGLGHDRIIARGGTSMASLSASISSPAAPQEPELNGGHDLWNDGCISMGQGHDTLDALPLGFTGSGTVQLGAGRDQLKGFGSGRFFGGRGQDTLTFNSGTYTITAAEDGTYWIGGTMQVKSFEAFGPGASTTSFAEAAAMGMVTFV